LPGERGIAVVFDDLLETCFEEGFSKEVFGWVAVGFLVVEEVLVKGVALIFVG
jgi:hypothetical protein